MKIITDLEKARERLSRRAAGGLAADAEQERVVRRIVNDVRTRGDAAILDYTEKLDGVRPGRLEVEKGEIHAAFRKISAGLLASFELAARRIRAFHARQKKALVRDSAGARLGWIMRPLERVGIYVPGGTAPLPSSLLMTALPARVAGVKEIIVVTPPQKTGKVAPVTLAAAKIAGVDRVFAAGGAQAIAAMAYGTESIPRVDKVCGPGNIYVMLAKQMVFGDVGIDGLYGPSEVVIIADDSANPEYIAADLLAQAEHGSGAAATLITASRQIAGVVNRELARQLKGLERREIIAASLEKYGLIIEAGTIGRAIELANLYAPEHLCLVVKDAASYVKKVRNAGCLFIGEDSVEVLVDYAAGPSHVLPTGGTARFGSPLNVTHFMKLITVVNMDGNDVHRLGRAASVLARAEGLDAHARAAEIRLGDMEREGK
jgi:histidinol dehydrogenase